MKNNILKIAILSLLIGCDKDIESVRTYKSVSEFLSANAVKAEFFTFDANAGGTFTTNKGTKIRIKPNTFKDQNGNLVSGQVTIEFKDIYSKSDMLFSDKPTFAIGGKQLVSGGEFFIKATNNQGALQIDPNKMIEIEQPIQAGILDTIKMNAFLEENDTAKNGGVWVPDTNSEVVQTASSYIFSLYQFGNPLTEGTWCNSDNSSYFNNFQQTMLRLNPLDNPDTFHTDVFLVFKGINSMIHVYRNWGTIYFDYNYAPVGLTCYLVAIGAKDEKMYYSIKEVNITPNLNVNFSMTPVDPEELKNKIKSLN